jgi:N-acetylneuraminic acid mutarotase
MWPVPLALRLHAESGGVHLEGLRFLLFGGIDDDSLLTVTADTYLYNHSKRTARKMASMLMPRFSFAYQRLGRRVYVAGGGNSDPDGNLILLDRCEYYDLDKDTWNNMSPLPVSLMSAAATAVRKELHVLGGLGENGKRSSSIYRYDE